MGLNFLIKGNFLLGNLALLVGKNGQFFIISSSPLSPPLLASSHVGSRKLLKPYVFRRMVGSHADLGCSLTSECFILWGSL